MSKIIHPYSHRLGIIRDWKSRWFAMDKNYRANLKGDVLIREMLIKELRGMYAAAIEFERNAKQLRIIIKTSRPGLIIGRGGDGSVKIKNKIVDLLRRKGLPIPEIKLDIEEIRSPESNAAVVAYMVAEALEKRMPFRRILKQTVEKVIANREVKGVRIALGGRLGGGEMARTEELKRGRIPLQTLRSDIDYAREKAFLPYGVIGVKVWLYRGDIFPETKQEAAEKRARANNAKSANA
jgi:small subunit ribosomal protein S3